MPSWKKLSKDSWTVTVSFGFDSLTGKRRQERWTYQMTKRDAEAQFARDLVERERGNGGRKRNDQEETFESFARRWLHTRDSKVEGETFDTYRARVEQHFIPAFGPLKMSALTPRMIDEAVSKWKNGPRLDRKKGPRADRTVHHMFALLRQMLEGAEREGLVERNPCRRVEPPKKGKTKPAGLQLHDAVAVIRGLVGSDLYAPVVVAILTGLRRGELLGLRWSDVDFDEGILRIERAATERRIPGENGQRRHVITTKAPKTDGSEREQPLGTFAAEVLYAHRETQEALAKDLGWKITPNTFVFGNATGGQISPDALSSAFVYAIQKHRLPKVSLKGLRTSFASALKRLGTDTKEIAELMGHTTDRTTKEHYLLEVPAHRRKAVNRLDREVSRMLSASDGKAVAKKSTPAKPRQAARKRA